MNFYVLALYAFREEPSKTPYMLHASYAVGASEAEVTAFALGELRRICPPEEGWTGHNVSATLVARDLLAEAWQAMGEQAVAESEDEDEEGPAM